MDKLKINFISQSRRCEICHQSDWYNPEENYCSRCDNATNQYIRNRRLSDPDLAFHGSYFSLFNFTQTQKIILGIVAVFVTTFSTLVVVPNFLSTRCRSTYGAAAVEAMRLFHSVQAAYQSGVGDGNFGTAEELLCEDLIDDVLAQSSGVLESDCSGPFHKKSKNLRTKAGYIFRLTVTKASPNKRSSFSVVAICVDEKHGKRNFFVDETGVIRASNNTSEIPDANSTPIGN